MTAMMEGGVMERMTGGQVCDQGRLVENRRRRQGGAYNTIIIINLGDTAVRGDY